MSPSHFLIIGHASLLSPSYKLSLPMTCPGPSLFRTPLSLGHSPLLAAFVLAQAKVRE